MKKIYTDVLGNGPKKKHIDKVESAIKSGNVTELKKILETSGYNKTTWTLDSIFKGSFDQYLEFNSIVIGNNPNPRKNPILYYHFSQELYFRAMFTDMEKTLSVFGKYPIEKIAQALKDVASEVKDQTVSFSTNISVAKKVFTEYHETYCKIMESFASLAAVINRDPEWNKKQKKTYLKNNLDGRYSVLLPTELEDFIRNAFSHQDYVVNTEGSFIFEHKNFKGVKRKEFKPDKLDKELNHMILRMHMINYGTSLPYAIETALMRTIHKLAPREESETS